MHMIPLIGFICRINTSFSVMLDEGIIQYSLHNNHAPVYTSSQIRPQLQMVEKQCTEWASLVGTLSGTLKLVLIQIKKPQFL